MDDPLLLVSFALLGVSITAVVLWYVWLRHRSSTWPRTVGKIEEIKVEVVDVRERLLEHAPFAATVGYSYSVAGDFYGGVLQKRFVLEGQAERCAAGYTVGSAIVVRYKPNAPQMSVMDEDGRE